MRLAEYTDYTLRVLMYCAANPGELVTIGELAERHELSKNHLMKIVNDLARQGLIETTRGRGGGLRLAKNPAEIRIGDVVRASETDFRLVECFDAGTNLCTLTPTCRLKQVFGDALNAYFKALDGATLADVAGPAIGPRKLAAGAVRMSVIAAPTKPSAASLAKSPAKPPPRSSAKTAARATRLARTKASTRTKAPAR